MITYFKELCKKSFLFFVFEIYFSMSKSVIPVTKTMLYLFYAILQLYANVSSNARKLSGFCTYNRHFNLNYTFMWLMIWSRVTEKLWQKCFQSLSLSVSVDIRMSKAVEDDKMGTELPVDSTGKNQYYHWLLKVCVSLNALRCSRNVWYVVIYVINIITCISMWNHEDVEVCV